MSWHDPNERDIDRVVWAEHDHITGGADAWHTMDPSELCAMAEEADAQADERERHALRDEVFSGFMEYLFAGGISPFEIKGRIEGLMEALAPLDLDLMRGRVAWVSDAAVDRVARRYAKRLDALEGPTMRLGDWMRQLRAESDALCVARTLESLIALIISEGRTWRSVVSMTYCMAKALRPWLIGGMSLSDIAILCGDKGRATPCARVKRLYTRRLEAAGARATLAHYMKSAGTVAKYRAAQCGNKNRKKNLRSKRTKTTTKP